jgi:glycosyltransferase involved in cell wall biosynthesis
MKIYYSVGFFIDNKTGRGTGTLSKIHCLSKICDEFCFSSYVFKTNRAYLLTKLINMILLWLSDVYYILFKINSYDVLIIRDNILFPIRLARLRKKLVCAEVHAVIWEETKNNNKTSSLSNIFKKLYLEMLRRSDAIIFNNSKLKSHFQIVENIKIPSLVSYNGGFFDVPFQSKKIYRKSGRIKFVYAGNIYPWHGVDLLIPIVKLLSEAIDLEFYLVGHTGSKYAQKVQDQFESMKACVVVKDSNKDVIKQYIQEADYCFLPTTNIRSSPGNPIKLFDYLAEGKRVITQENCPGYSDVVNSVDAGINIDLYDPDKAVRKILSSGLSSSNIKIEQRIFQISKRLHSWEVRMIEWIKFIKSLRSAA